MFDPTLLPKPCTEVFNTYGQDKIADIAKHYMPSMPSKENKLVSEFNLFKYHMSALDILKGYKMTDETQTTQVSKRLINIQSRFPLLC